MRSRPEIELRMPRTVYPGKDLLVEIKLISGSPTPIDFVHIHFEGVETTRSQINNEAQQVIELVHLLAKVVEKGSLAADTYTYRTLFSVPASAPPTYLGTLVEYRYWVKVHVAIPWWLDVEESYEATVTLPHKDRPAARPHASTTLKGNEPFVEVSLANQRYAPGDVIEGGLAFGNIGGRTVRGMDLSLVGYEVIHRFRDRSAEAHRFTAFKSVDDMSEGREVPFRFAIPTVAMPSFETARAALNWVFEVRLDLRGGPDVVHVTPLVLAPFDRPAEAGAMRRKVGAGRWHAVWDDVGKRAGLALDPTELQLVGSIAGCDVIVRIGDARADKEGLVGELRYPNLGLGLSIQNGGLLNFGIDLGDERFEDRFRVRGRDEAQIREALLPELRKALLGFDEVYLDDAHVTVRSRSPGHDQPWIGRFVAQIAELAAALTEATTKIPPPPPMAALLPAWQRFAQDLGGRFQVGKMSILEARLDGSSFDIETDFGRSALPERTLITLAIDPPLPQAEGSDNLEALAGAAASSTPLPAGIRPGARQIVAHLKALARGLRVSEQAMVIELPAPLVDPAEAREAMAAMLALAEMARGERRISPYR
jgi:hypothetical protein